MLETSHATNLGNQHPSLPPDHHRLAVTMVGHDEESPFRLARLMALHRVVLLQLDTVRHEDMSATMAMTVHDPNQRFARLPSLFGRLVEVTRVTTFNPEASEWVMEYPPGENGEAEIAG